MENEVIISKSVLKEIGKCKLTLADKMKLDKILKTLASGDFSSLDMKLFKQAKPLQRIRMGSYRIFVDIDTKANIVKVEIFSKKKDVGKRFS